MREQKNLTPEDILGERIGRIQRRREWWNFLVECAAIVAILYVLFQYVIGIAFVSGTSMEPYLQDGELVVFYRLDKEYQRDDVVIIHRSGNVEYIKRIVGCAGDELALTEEGALLRNGEKEEASCWTGRTEALPGQVVYPYTVPERSYFVLGDNRENSRDSREFGAVRNEEITGRVIAHLGFTK